MTIDGYSQPGASPNTLAVANDAVLLIELSGALVPLGTDGLRLDTDDSVVRGLVINGWKPPTGSDLVGGRGVVMLAGADSNVVRGDFIGTNAAGTMAVANAIGVDVIDAADNLVGGTSPADRNVISGNARSGIGIRGDGSTRNRVLGIYIGTDATGEVSLANMDGARRPDAPASVDAR